MHTMHEVSLSSIDLNLLVLLRALLNERHVTRAARRVGLSQSAASHALTRLRELYRDPLLVRRGRALELTPRAQLLVPELEQGLSHLEGTLRAQPTFDPRHARRTFTITAADYLQATLVAPLLRRLSVEAPGFELTLASFTNVFDLLESGQVDFSLVAKQTLPSQFSARRLYSDGFVCMARKRHPLTLGRRLSLEQYLSAGHLLVAPSGSPGSLLDTELARRGLVRRIAARVSSFLAVPTVVSASDLISTGPELLWRQLAPLYSLELHALPLRVPRFDIDLIWHCRRDSDEAHAFLRDALALAAKETWKTSRPA